MCMLYYIPREFANDMFCSLVRCRLGGSAADRGGIYVCGTVGVVREGEGGGWRCMARLVDRRSDAEVDAGARKAGALSLTTV
jgi:hypothetical protein